ncbi:hypothetical protein RKE30_00065 [Streptomyces sp. Li-HN-5-11]|nr:hypothetical protein [Streptomyces sp. Li-HN-5-11]WNM28916.1 hypothetical protein RKE30_00065 [Streptomyces sp. Li-HN-5-11]
MRTVVRGAVRWAVVAVALCLVAAGPGDSVAAAGSADPDPYAFTDGTRQVAGATTAAHAERLDPGRTYRSSLPSNGKLYFRLHLDATSTVYVSATAVPGAGTTVAATDGLQLSVKDPHGNPCSFHAASFGASRSPRPIAAWGVRDASPGHVLCQGAGTYSVHVERVDATGSSADTWPLELAVASEPPLTETGATSAPQSWNSASPAPVTGQAVDRAGGAGFAAASAVGQGVWRDRIRPGQTLFYRVPVDWGQQLNATAELDGSSGGSGYTEGAVTLSLYNPVRGEVEEAYAGYAGRQTSAALAPLPPVDYTNRYGFADQVKGMRFAGSYYLVVHLAAQTADVFGQGPYGLTLRVRVSGAAQPGPAYAGRPDPRKLFDVTVQTPDAARPGGPAGAAGAAGPAGGGSTALRVLAAGGIGAGTVLLIALGVWTVLARRRAGAL